MGELLDILKKSSLLVFQAINNFIQFLKNTYIFDISLFSFFLLFILLAVVVSIWGDSE